MNQHESILKDLRQAVEQIKLADARLPRLSKEEVQQWLASEQDRLNSDVVGQVVKIEFLPEQED